MKVSSRPSRHNQVNQVFDRIEIRAPLRHFSVLEAFGGDGSIHAIDYALRPTVAALTAYEADPKRAALLKQAVPAADVKVVDAYREVHSLAPHFDVIMVDSDLLDAPHFEHFDLFPAIFKGLAPCGFLVVSVCVDPDAYFASRETFVRRRHGERSDDFVRGWDRARADFYGFPRPEKDAYAGQIGGLCPVSSFPSADMVPIYADMALKAGFSTRYHAVIERTWIVKYILLELEKLWGIERNINRNKEEETNDRKDLPDPAGHRNEGR